MKCYTDLFTLRWDHFRVTFLYSMDDINVRCAYNATKLCMFSALSSCTQNSSGDPWKVAPVDAAVLCQTCTFWSPPPQFLIMNPSNGTVLYVFFQQNVHGFGYLINKPATELHAACIRSLVHVPLPQCRFI